VHVLRRKLIDEGPLVSARLRAQRVRVSGHTGLLQAKFEAARDTFKGSPILRRST